MTYDSHDVGDDADGPDICRRTNHLTLHHLRSWRHIKTKTAAKQ